MTDPRLPVRIQVGLATALAVGLILSVIAILGWLDPVQQRLADFLYQDRPASGHVVVIAIDDKSITELGSPPWPRSHYTALLSRLQEIQPRAIALDVNFADPPNEDQAFADRVRELKNVILPVNAIPTASSAQVAGPQPAKASTIPGDTLRAAAGGLGHRTILPDRDGVVRRVTAALRVGDQTYFALGLLAAARYYGGDPVVDWGRNEIAIGPSTRELESQASILLSFAGGAGDLRTVSFVDAVNSRVSLDFMRDQVILVGPASTGEPDVYLTPLTPPGRPVSNVRLEAQLADMWLSDPPRTLQSQDALGVIIAIILMAVIAGLTLPHLQFLPAAGVGLLYLLAFLMLAFQAFSAGILFNVVLPPLALVFTSAPLTLFRYWTEERPRLRLANLFRRYLPGEWLEHVVDSADRGELPLHGEQRQVTVLYADLRGCDRMLETDSPESVLERVNQALAMMVQVVSDEGATLHKPVGDAVIAVWNAPLDQPDHVVRALHAAQSIRERLFEMQVGHSESDLVKLGMAIVTGSALAGNLTALGVPEYTLIGQPLTAAAHICVLANSNQILATQETAAMAPPEIELRELPPVHIRGRKEPVAVYEVRGIAEPQPQTLEPAEGDSI